jgi:Kef-type K+ transport system membrane component KefB/nucleotide-binding universal stress UspA family protein
MEQILSPLSGHAILVLLLQLALLLIVARSLADLMVRIGQPAVIGELLAGVLLGPTIFGHFSPELFMLAFPQEVAQFQLLEAVSWLGMILLLLLTGLETDIRLMRNLGRAATMASVFGMVIPFGSGLALGWLLPDQYLTDPDTRPVFAAFLATAMAISAMPVIAKILMDLNLIRRNVGMVILSAAVVDDTTGWIILSVIAGLAAGGTFSIIDLGMTLLWLVVFVAAIRWLAYPLLVRAVRYVNEQSRIAGADITLILCFTFVCAAATEAVGIHAVFGAFVAGVVVRQIPRVRTSALETLETFVLSALAPVFFAFVGLKVDLWTLSGWGFPALVIGVALGGKLVGCYIGGRLGRLSHWESVAIGFGMNARGAMELIVALIGLSLGLLTQEVYATIVMVAVVTSFMAPILLRWVAPRIPLGEEERHRLDAATRELFIPTGPLRVLVPTAGGANAMLAIEIAAPLTRRGQGRVTALYVDTHRKTGYRTRLRRERHRLTGTNLSEHLERAATVADDGDGHFTVRRVQSSDVADAVLDEVVRDYDLLLLGAAPARPLDDPLVVRIAENSPVPVVIVRGGGGATAQGPSVTDKVEVRSRLLVPVDGSRSSRYAAEVAFAYAGAVGTDVRILHVVDSARRTAGSRSSPSTAAIRLQLAELETQLEEELGPIAGLHGASISIRILASGSPGDVIVGESWSGHYDLLVLGAENKLFGQPLFFGQGTADIAERSGCNTAVVLPGAT